MMSGVKSRAKASTAEGRQAPGGQRVHNACPLIRWNRGEQFPEHPALTSAAYSYLPTFQDGARDAWTQTYPANHQAPAL